jgi:hypothetical protein
MVDGPRVAVYGGYRTTVQIWIEDEEEYNLESNNR